MAFLPLNNSNSYDPRCPESAKKIISLRLLCSTQGRGCRITPVICSNFVHWWLGQMVHHLFKDCKFLFPISVAIFVLTVSVSARSHSDTHSVSNHLCEHLLQEYLGINMCRADATNFLLDQAEYILQNWNQFYIRTSQYFFTVDTFLSWSW